MPSKVYLIGNAHIDPVWQWRWQEGLSEIKATFKSVLDRMNEFSDFKIIGQIFSEFIILEKNDKMILLDFHAGHERLNYDKFTKLIENREIVVQDLLVPYVHELTSLEETVYCS